MPRIAAEFSVCPLGNANDEGMGGIAWASGGRARAVRVFRDHRQRDGSGCCRGDEQRGPIATGSPAEKPDCGKRDQGQAHGVSQRREKPRNVCGHRSAVCGHPFKRWNIPAGKAHAHLRRDPQTSRQGKDPSNAAMTNIKMEPVLLVPRRLVAFMLISLASGHGPGLGVGREVPASAMVFPCGKMDT